MLASTESTILSFEEARRAVEQQASKLRPHGRELVALLESPGRALAEAIYADRDFPPFPRATRDGYAVRAVDVQSVPATLEIIGEAKAGGAGELAPLDDGQAVSIMTGAEVPAGTDAVVMVEFTSRTGVQVEVQRSVVAGENIVLSGAEARKGQQLLAVGTKMDYAAVAVAASVGRLRVLVSGKPRIAVLSTGDEVVDIDVPPGANQIRNSNSYSLAAQILAAGGEPVLLPIAPDEPERLRELLLEGLESDLLLIAGGVSMGKYDLVESILAELRAEFFFTGAKIQPGKPAVFGRVLYRAEAETQEAKDHKYFFGLPGNPISTMVCFELFARPMIETLAGLQPKKLIFTHAKLKAAVRTKTGLKRFLPAILSGEFEAGEVELVSWRGSGDIAAMGRSNCFVVIPSDHERSEAGEWVPVLLR